MNITELRYLVAIKKWGSVSAAAKQLYAAQPNVSKALKNLEGEYGLRIFERLVHRHDPHRAGAAVHRAGRAGAGRGRPPGRRFPPRPGALRRAAGDDLPRHLRLLCGGGFPERSRRGRPAPHPHPGGRLHGGAGLRAAPGLSPGAAAVCRRGRRPLHPLLRPPGPENGACDGVRVPACSPTGTARWPSTR